MVLELYSILAMFTVLCIVAREYRQQLRKWVLVIHVLFVLAGAACSIAFWFYTEGIIEAG